MGKKKYSELLLDPRWQKRRLEVLQNSDWECKSCYAKDSTLHVHHKHYVQGRDPWEYEDSQLVVLCDDCHSSRHESDKKLHNLLARADVTGMPGNVDDLYWLIAGFLSYDDAPAHHAEKVLYKIGSVAAEGCWHGFKGIEL